MPSVGNPNGPSKNRLAARASRTKKIARQKSAAGQTKISKAAMAHGARPGLRAASGPTRKLSAKKERKLAKQMGYALKRKAEAEGVVEMKDAPETESKAEGDAEGAAEADMDIQ